MGHLVKAAGGHLVKAASGHLVKEHAPTDPVDVTFTDYLEDVHLPGPTAVRFVAGTYTATYAGGQWLYLAAGLRDITHVKVAGTWYVIITVRENAGTPSWSASTTWTSASQFGTYAFAYHNIDGDDTDAITAVSVAWA